MARTGGVRHGKVKEVFEPSEAALHDCVRDAFPQIQRAWNDRDLDVFSRLATDAYVSRARPVVDELDRNLQINRIEGPDLRDVAVSRPRQDADGTQADAYLAFVLRDWLEDLRTTEIIRGDPEALLSFVERWSFVFDEARGWALDRVSTVWSGGSTNDGVELRGLPAGRYSRRDAPARWVEWDGSAWTPESPVTS